MKKIMPQVKPNNLTKLGRDTPTANLKSKIIEINSMNFSEKYMLMLTLCYSLLFHNDYAKWH